MFGVLRPLRAISAWELWQHPRKVVLHVLFSHAIAAAILVSFSILGERPSGSQWLFLLLCIVGVLSSREVERRFGARRLQTGGDGSVDVTFQLTDCWILAAVIIVPMPAVALALASGLFAALWGWFIHQRRQRISVGAGARVARAPSSPHKVLMNHTTDVIALGLAHLLFTAVQGDVLFEGSSSPVRYLLASLVAFSAVMYFPPLWIGFLMALASGRSWWGWVKEMVLDHWKAMHSTAAVGVVMPLVWTSSAPAATLVFIPVLAVFCHALLMGSIVDTSMVDETTGAANKRYWKTTARACLDYAASGNLPFSVAVLDLDHFKRVNDTYGHLVGDVVLKEVVSRLNAVVRPTDLVGRFGGEEFVILLPGCDEALALQVAERCRAAMEEAPLAISDGQEVRGTISIGVSSSEALSGELEDFLKRADEALYMAKKSGRNMVIGPTALAVREEAVVTVLRPVADVA